MKNVISLNDENFEQHVLEKKKLIVVDFWAKWCNPCKILSKILEELLDDYKNHTNIFFFKINIDENPKTVQKYEIRSIPTLLLFKDGKLIDTIIGASSKSQLKLFFNKYIT